MNEQRDHKLLAILQWYASVSKLDSKVSPENEVLLTSDPIFTQIITNK